MSKQITATEIIKTVVFNSLKASEQAIVYQAAACDKIGAHYDMQMSEREIAEFTRIRECFFPVHKPGRMFPRFANNGEPTDLTSYDWELRQEAKEAIQPKKSYIVRYYDRSRGADQYVDQTSVDEDNEQLIWKLFEEFGYKQTDDTFYEIEPVTEVVVEYPITGWHDTEVFSLSYADIEVLIDRQAGDEVEIRVWQNGKEEYSPHAKMSFTVETFVCGHCTSDDIESAECDECEFCVNCCLHRDTDDDLKGKVTLDQVYQSLESALDVACDVDTQNAISDEYRRQIRKRYEADKPVGRPARPNIEEPIKDGERSHLFSEYEIYELKTWANGYLKAVDSYVEMKNYVEDDWVEYELPSGEIADIQLSRNDDEQGSGFNKIEAFAYRTKTDTKGLRISDTDDCVRLV